MPGMLGIAMSAVSQLISLDYRVAAESLLPGGTAVYLMVPVSDVLWQPALYVHIWGDDCSAYYTDGVFMSNPPADAIKAARERHFSFI